MDVNELTLPKNCTLLSNEICFKIVLLLKGEVVEIREQGRQWERDIAVNTYPCAQVPGGLIIGPYPSLTLALESLVDEPVEEGAAVVAERGGGVGVQTEPVLRSHSLTSATSKTKAIFGQLFRTFLGFRFRGAGYTELSMAPVCYLHYTEVNLTLTLVTYRQKNLLYWRPWWRHRGFWVYA